MRSIAELIRIVNSTKCKGLCWYSCVEALGVSKTEDDRIREFCEKNGIPYHDLKLTMPAEAMAMKLLAAQQGAVEFEACPFLSSDHRCTIHPVRPGICRAYGSSLAPMLVCVHGCETDGRPLSRQETDVYIAHVDHGGDP